MPSTMGLPLRATTSSFGFLVSSTTRPYVPSTWRSVRRTASSRLVPSVASAAIMWASASVSVSLTSLTPRAGERVPELLGVLDDAVVHDGDAALGVGVRMSVHLVRLTVGGPPGVADADGGPGAVADPVPEVLDPAGRLGDLQPVPVDDGQAGRVVAAVLQAPQTLEQHRHRVPAADVSHDSAHCRAPPVRLALAVDDAPELALRQCWRREPALPELGRDQRPDLVVLVLALL